MLTSLLPLSEDLRVDAYLHWAFHTDFLYMRKSSHPTLVVLVRFKTPLNLRTKGRSMLPAGVSISPVYHGARHATVTVSNDRKIFEDQIRALQNAPFNALCFELGTPEGFPLLDPRIGSRARGPGPETVLGVIDDGCPFAHSLHRHRQAAPKALAVRFIWDQGGDAGASATPAPFGYGRFFYLKQLRALMQSATVSGRLHEEAAYRTSELPSLSSATSHGAHVMSLMSGWKNPTVPRPSAFQSSPPINGQPPVERSDIAFVQLKAEALDDPSGGWLDHDALAGMYAIRWYARHAHGTSQASKVIINLSYGPQTGPHDGSSVLETAMQELISEAPKDSKPYDLQIVLPAGNNHLLKSHAEFDLDRGGGEVRWCVAPDSQVPAYLEIWLPRGMSFGDLSEAALIAPTDERVDVIFQKPTQTNDKTAGTIAIPTCQYADRIVILMVIMPTAREPGAAPTSVPLAPLGRWTILIKSKNDGNPKGVAHAYLARADPNMGRGRRGRSGYLDSDNYDPRRYLRPSEQLEDNGAVDSAAVLARGAISGIATADATYAAAGYCATTSKPAPYSSGGAARPDARYGPSWAYPTDQSIVLRGVLGAGNRSGIVTRLVGTSFAAPMLARDLWMVPSLPPSARPPINPPPPWPSWKHHRFGNGLRE